MLIFFQSQKNNIMIHHRRQSSNIRSRKHKLTKSTQFGQTNAQPNRARNATLSSNFFISPKVSLTHIQQFPCRTVSSEDEDKARHAKNLQKLYTRLIKYKENHGRTVSTAKQKERFLHRFGKTLGNNEFKGSGFELNNQCLSYVFDFIKKNREINKIVLDGNTLEKQALSNLAELVKEIPVQELSLVGVGLNNKGAQILFKALKIRRSIKKLNISSNDGLIKNKITAEGVDSLRMLLNSQNCNLDTLKMDGITLGNQGLKVAFDNLSNPPLEVLTLSKNQLTFRYLSSFMGNISNIALLRLDLSKNNIGNEGMKILSGALGTNYGRSRLSINLNYLNLADNHINSTSFEPFCRQVYCNKTIETLILDNNPLGQGQRFFNIKYFLSKNWRMKTLSLSNISLMQKDLRFLCQGMQENKSLEDLNLSNNEVDSDCWYDILSMLMRNKNLRRLNLSSCKICDNYLIKNEDLFINQQMQRLQQLNLDNNYLGNKGAQVLKNMVQNFSTIMKISLGRNCIGEKLLLKISALLKQNERKKPFQKELYYYYNQLEMYDQKRIHLKGEVQEMKKKEEELKTNKILEQIRNQARVEQELREDIRVQKMSILKMGKGKKPTRSKRQSQCINFQNYITAPPNFSVI